jgi:hypothetical protein
MLDGGEQQPVARPLFLRRLAATSSRARSTKRRAARPSAWTEDGLPATPSACVSAAAACGRNGAVAFQSR